MIGGSGKENVIVRTIRSCLAQKQITYELVVYFSFYIVF